LCKPGRVQRLKVTKEIVAQVELDAPTHTIQELTHAVTETASDDRRCNHQRREG
jgi:hypothetical protein